MSKKKKSINVASIVLIVSALILGMLIVILVAVNKKKITINSDGASKGYSGECPLPHEIQEKDMQVYFACMEIPDMIFNRMNNVSFEEDCPVDREDLRYLKILYWGTDGKPHSGEMIVNKAIAEDVRQIFFKLYKGSYPIESIRLVDEYGGNDEGSMKYNNTSCFNSRKIKGSEQISLHAYGLAIDINPFYNPYVGADGVILPLEAEEYADRDAYFKMKIDKNDYAYKLFTEAGFTWGGDWKNNKDYQHFEKKK